MEEEAEKVGAMAKELEKNATELREADVEGAYNITKESAAKSQEAQRRADTTEAVVGQSESTRTEAENLLDRNERDFEQHYDENQEALEELDQKVGMLGLARKLGFGT